jgi:predicted SnoaL-like aldol condensation-catalyzing enzyme
MSTHHPNRSDAKRVVLDFFDLAFVRREPAQAAERYLGDAYTQHNPTAPDGAAVFPDLIGGLFAQAPDASFHLTRAIAEDDLVVLHYNLKFFPDDLGQAVVDIFRVQDGRIVEHWDVMQPVPAESANDNGMF